MQRNSVKPSKTRYSPMKLSNSRLKLTKKNSKTRYKPTKLGQTRYKLHKAKGNPAPARLNWVWKKKHRKIRPITVEGTLTTWASPLSTRGCGVRQWGAPKYARHELQTRTSHRHNRAVPYTTTPATKNALNYDPCKTRYKKNKHLNTAKPRKTQ